MLSQINSKPFGEAFAKGRHAKFRLDSKGNLAGGAPVMSGSEKLGARQYAHRPIVERCGDFTTGSFSVAGLLRTAEPAPQNAKSPRLMATPKNEKFCCGPAGTK
ncbi:MAG TPA: hypothetical protein VL984_03745 [Acidimicrobiales bacterium]|nr:hypothetical protein [Acidimicrobiales bacterium]